MTWTRCLQDACTAPPAAVIEWPESMGALLRARALDLGIEIAGDESRTLS